MKPTYTVKNGKLVVCNNGAYLSFTPEDLLNLHTFVQWLVFDSRPLSQKMVDDLTEYLED